MVPTYSLYSLVVYEFSVGNKGSFVNMCICICIGVGLTYYAVERFEVFNQPLQIDLGLQLLNFLVVVSTCSFSWGPMYFGG